jgi:hypothetical protein
MNMKSKNKLLIDRALSGLNYSKNGQVFSLRDVRERLDKWLVQPKIK